MFGSKVKKEEEFKVSMPYVSDIYIMLQSNS